MSKPRVPDYVVHQVLQLKAEHDYAYRKIARIMKISRGTVLAILRDPDKYLAKDNDDSSTELSRPEPPMKDGVRLPDMTAPYTWCGSCNAWVRPPCLACQIRAFKRRKRNASTLLQSLGASHDPVLQND